MSLIRLRAEDCAYPVLFLRREWFEVWQYPASAGSAFSRTPSTGDRLGQLVDRQGLTYNVVGAEETPEAAGGDATLVKRRRSLPGVTLICDGEPHTTSVDALVKQLAWIVSARGHFESPQGFGFPIAVTLAATVEDLIEALIVTRYR